MCVTQHTNCRQPAPAQSATTSVTTISTRRCVHWSGEDFSPTDPTHVLDKRRPCSNFTFQATPDYTSQHPSPIHIAIMQSDMSPLSFLPFADNYSPPWSRMTLLPFWPCSLSGWIPLGLMPLTLFFLWCRKAQRGLWGFHLMFESKEVFGPVGLANPPCKGGVGAIGDGRKSWQSPELDDDACLVSCYFWRIYSPFLSYRTLSSSCRCSISTLWVARHPLNSLLAFWIARP